MKWDYSAVDYPTIYVDVDGTLLLWKGHYGDGDPKPNAALIEHLKKESAEGVRLYLWSRAGPGHAKRAAQYCEISNLFDGFLQKPQQTFDDDYGWMDAIERNSAEPPKPKLIVRRA